MRIAIRGHDFGKRGEFKLCEMLEKYDFDGVQLVPYKTYNDIPYSPDITSVQARAIGQEISDASKKVFLLGAYFNPVHSVTGKVENGIATFKRYLELAELFGCNIVGSETGSFNDDKWTYNPLNRTDEALFRVIEIFKDLCLFAKSRGVNVGIEGASGHVCFSPDRLKQAVDAICEDNLKIIFDIYNYLDDDNYLNYMSIMERGIQLFDGKIHCFHIKDCKIIDGKLKQCAVGSGIFDFNKLLSLIKQTNFDPILILEGTVGEDILPSARFIKNIWSMI